MVVTSEPSGAEVTFDGNKAGTTPLVIEEVWLSRPHEISLEAPGAKAATLVVEPEAGKAYRRVHARLENAMGALQVDSEPSGAEVRLDDKSVGTTPLTLRGVKLDERHRIDLSLPGYEVDQFMVLPEKDGTRFTRKLGKTGIRTAPPPGPRAP